MIVIKPREEPTELYLLRLLSARQKLSLKDQRRYMFLKKGFEGEQNFDIWSEGFSEGNLILNDLLLEVNNTHFQIDSLVISNNMIFLFEIKNYEGDFYIEKDRWYTISKLEIKNPIYQLKRSESLLRQVLQEKGYNIEIKANIIFMSPNFQLYQSPLHLPVIFPSQLERNLEKFKKSAYKTGEKEIRLAEKLAALHLSESPFNSKSQYRYESVKKGIVCVSCQSFILNEDLSAKSVLCTQCGFTEKIEDSIIRSANEFAFLFPEQQLTTNSVQEWCAIIKSKKMIRKTLANNFTIVRKGRSTHYIQKY